MHLWCFVCLLFCVFLMFVCVCFVFVICFILLCLLCMGVTLFYWYWWGWCVVCVPIVWGNYNFRIPHILFGHIKQNISIFIQHYSSVCGSCWMHRHLRSKFIVVSELNVTSVFVWAAFSETVPVPNNLNTTNHSSIVVFQNSICVVYNTWFPQFVVPPNCQSLIPQTTFVQRR